MARMAIGAKTTMVLALVAVIMLTPSMAGACDCERLDDETYFANADVVFTGTVADRFFAKPWDRSGVDTLVFDVAAVHKGDVQEEQEVRTHSESTACGFGAEVGATYLIFADRGGDGQLEVTICGGSRTDTAPVDLPQMESARPSPGESDTSGTIIWWSAMVVASLTTAITAAVMWWRHHRGQPGSSPEETSPRHD